MFTRTKPLDADISLPILWIWLCILVAAIAGYWVVKWWKKRYPPPRPEPELPYAKRLQHRYDQGRAKGHAADAVSRDKGAVPRAAAKPTTTGTGKAKV